MNNLIKGTNNLKIYEIVKTFTINSNLNLLLKCAYSQSSGSVTESEIQSILRQKFPAAKEIFVEDTSGGCGAMFNVGIETNEFKGLSIMKQHRMVYDVLKEQIKNIHGIHLETRVPK